MYDEDGFEILDHDQDSYDYPGEVDLDDLERDYYDMDLDYDEHEL